MNNFEIYALTRKTGGGVSRSEVQKMIDTSIADIDALVRKVVASVSDIDVDSPDADKYIYMVPKGTTAAGDNYDEYMVVDKSIEHIGDTTIDLSDYVKRTVDDRATSTQLGLIMADATHGITTNAKGNLVGFSKTIDQVTSNSGTMILSVGTARNCAEEWTLTLADGTTITKNVFVVPPKG